MKPHEQTMQPQGKVDPIEMEAYMALALSSEDENVKQALAEASTSPDKAY